MYWMLAGLGVCGAIVIAGRAHSRRLDELDKEAWVVLTHPPDVAFFCHNCGVLGVRSDCGDGALSRVDHKCDICNSRCGTFGALQGRTSR
jgi:hypothetical protein